MSRLMDEASKAAQILYNSDKDQECQLLALQWAVDELIATMCADNLATAFDIHAKLESMGCDSNNQYEYNDMDNHAYIVEWKDKEEKAFVISDQNFNFLYRLRADTAFQKSQMFIYTFEGAGQLRSLIHYGRSKYNDLRDQEYVCGSHDVMVGKAPDCPVWKVPEARAAFMRLNSIWWDE